MPRTTREGRSLLVRRMGACRLGWWKDCTGNYPVTFSSIVPYFFSTVRVSTFVSVAVVTVILTCLVFVYVMDYEFSTLVSLFSWVIRSSFNFFFFPWFIMPFFSSINQNKIFFYYCILSLKHSVSVNSFQSQSQPWSPTWQKEWSYPCSWT